MFPLDLINSLVIHKGESLGILKVQHSPKHPSFFLKSTWLLPGKKLCFYQVHFMTVQAKDRFSPGKSLAFYLGKARVRFASPPGDPQVKSCPDSFSPGGLCAGPVSRPGPVRLVFPW